MSALATLSESKVLSAHQSPVQTIVFGSDPHFWRPAILSGGQRFGIAATCSSSLTSPAGKTRSVRQSGFGGLHSPGGETLYAACGDKVSAISMTTAEPRWTYQPPRSFGFLIISPIALSVAGSGDVAVATDAGRMSVWTPEGAMKAHWWDNDNPRQLAFVEGERVIGTDSFSVCTWKTTGGRKVSRRRLEERAYGFAATPDGSRICLRSIHSVEVFDIEAQTLIERYPLDFGPPLVSISDDGKRVAVGGLNDVYVYTVGQQRSVRLHVGAAAPRALKLSSDGHTAAVGCSDGNCSIWEP